MSKLPDPRTVAEYDEGYDAFNGRVTIPETPYDNTGQAFSLQRVAWITGWLDARTNHRHGRTFEKYGLRLLPN